MKASLTSRLRLLTTALVLPILFLGSSSLFARTEKDFVQNSDLNNGNNYSPPGLPTSNNDVLLTTSSTSLTLDAANLNMGSVNQTNNLAYTISNNTPGSTNSNLTLGGGGINTIGADPNDLVYVGGATSSLTFQGPNGDDGTGTLGLGFVQSGNFDVAQPGATLNISSNFTIPGQCTKIGAGTLNVSGSVGGLGVLFAVNAGTLNFLSGATIGGRVGLSVNNPNTGAGTNVTVNLQTSETFNWLSGTIAMPSTGTNTATVNLIGGATELSLNETGPDPTYAGTIAGNGSVFFVGIGTRQTFAGNNTYTGTTTIGGGLLIIDGTTSGQGNYIVGLPGIFFIGLFGSGTIGLQGNGTVSVQEAMLGPGPETSVGTLNVATSGTGGVIFAENSRFSVEVAGSGSSDLLTITGGSINLTNSSNTLTLNSLANGFDGSDYTIATFTQNVNGGTFDIVQGLPSSYTVQYNPTNIRLLALQLPLQLTAAVSRKMHGSAGSFDVNLLLGDPVECRSSAGNHTLLFTFTNKIVSGSASVTTGIGSVSGNPTFSGKTMTVNLTGVADVQKIAVTLHNVTDRFSQVLPDTVVSINMLIGDTTGNKAVNASDIAQTKGQSGLPATGSNFREDVTVNGVITASDISLVKSRSGAFIPP